MVNPTDFLPALYEYGNIVHEYLCKHLSHDQISAYLDYLGKETTTHGEAFRCITEEHGHPKPVFYAISSLYRINALCNDALNAAECPSEEPLEPGHAFLGAFLALQAGMMIGATADPKGEEAIMKLAALGGKFDRSVGRKAGKFSQLLESIVSEYYRQNHGFPDYLKVIRLLKNEIGKGLVHSVDETEGIEYGASGDVGIPALKNKLSEIRKKIESP